MTLHEIKKRNAGDTDVAAATVVYCGKHGLKSRVINLCGDGSIYIKEATNAVTVNDYYIQELTRAKWLMIYDDTGKIYDTNDTIRNGDFDASAVRSWSIYLAGNTIAIIANFKKDYLIDVNKKERC